MVKVSPLGDAETLLKIILVVFWVECLGKQKRFQLGHNHLFISHQTPVLLEITLSASYFMDKKILILNIMETEEQFII
jgi:hypothetical protein